MNEPGICMWPFCPPCERHCRRAQPVDGIGIKRIDEHDCTWCKQRHSGYSIMDCPESKKEVI